MYEYAKYKNSVFTEDGQVRFLAIRDRVRSKLADSGAVRMQEAMRGSTGDSWEIMACIDRLVELGEIREIEQERVAAQHRVFVADRAPRN